MHATAHSSSTIENHSSVAGLRLSIRNAVIDDPRIAPRVPATPIRPKSRRPCRSEWMSVMKDQKTDTTNRLKTAVQTKNDRPAQIAA